MVYNPLPQRRVGFIDVPISWSEVCVTDNNGENIESQVLPFRHPNLIKRGQRQHPYTLMLPIEKVRPLSVGVFHVSRGKGREGMSFGKKRPEPEEHKEPWHAREQEDMELTPDAVVDNDNDNDMPNGAIGASLPEISRNLRADVGGGSGTNFTISNGLVTLTFDGVTGRLSRMETHGGVGGEGVEESLDVDQGWFFYPSFGGGGMASTAGQEASRLKGSEGQKGGAYIFRPEGDGDGSHGIPVGSSTSSRSSSSGDGEERGCELKEWWVEEGPLVSEVHQVTENILWL